MNIEKFKKDLKNKQIKIFYSHDMKCWSVITTKEIYRNKKFSKDFISDQKKKKSFTAFDCLHRRWSKFYYADIECYNIQKRYY